MRLFALPEPAALDRAILASCGHRYRKVAMVLWRAEQALGWEGDAIDEALTARIEAMIAGGRLEAVGNVRNWRHSEVRLPGTSETEPA